MYKDTKTVRREHVRCFRSNISPVRLLQTCFLHMLLCQLVFYNDAVREAHNGKNDASLTASF